MKTVNLFAMWSVSLVTVLSSDGQTAFQNLNFENANPVLIVPSPAYPYAVTPSSALPGWSGSINGVPVTQVILNTYSLGTASIDILGPGWEQPNPGIIGGDYTVFLQAFNTGQGNVSLWQNGTIPANAASLQFKAWQEPTANEAYSVSFAGNSLLPVALSYGQGPSGQPYTVYGVDIAPYAGDTGRLEFTAVAGNGESGIELDDITFSPNAVPEPSTVALLVMGGLALAARRWRGNRKLFGGGAH